MGHAHHRGMLGRDLAGLVGSIAFWISRLEPGHLRGHLSLSSSSGARKHSQYRSSSVDAASMTSVSGSQAYRSRSGPRRRSQKPRGERIGSGARFPSARTAASPVTSTSAPPAIAEATTHSSSGSPILRPKCLEGEQGGDLYRLHQANVAQRRARRRQVRRGCARPIRATPAPPRGCLEAAKGRTDCRPVHRTVSPTGAEGRRTRRRGLDDDAEYRALRVGGREPDQFHGRVPRTAGRHPVALPPTTSPSPAPCSGVPAHWSSSPVRPGWPSCRR